MPSAHIDRRRELLTAWERRAQARGGAEHCSGADALFLVTALSNALRRASETPELGRAARTWGARFSSPVDALATLATLRDALVGLAEDSAAGLPVPLSVLNRVFDHAALEAVDAASANLRSEARNDPLTGCANRRALHEELAHAAASARRSNLDLAVAVVDLDGLKQINDTQGHAAGDAALVELVVALRRALREADTLYRTGGDEFVVVAPFTDAAGARALMRRAERMGGPTFSWGVASLAAATAAVGDVDTAVLMDAADTDLYERRRANRRATVVAARRRTATVVASVAASVVVTGAMSGLALALSAGGAAPASSSVSQAAATARGGPHWPAPDLKPVGSALAPQVGRGNPVGGSGTSGTSLVGALETVVPPSLASQALAGVPLAVPSGVITVSYSTPPAVPGLQPLALLGSSGAGPVTAAASGPSAPAPQPAAPGAPNGGAPNGGGPSGGVGPKGGGPNGNGNDGRAGGPAAPAAAPQGPDGGHGGGESSVAPGHAKH